MKHTFRELRYVELSNGRVIKAGFGACVDIILSDTGKGPMGWYDVITAGYRGEQPEVHPAHHCLSWKFAEPES